jgi:sugar porter (SP) family MFS transporter
MLGVAAIPGAALAIGMLTVPRTPRWLVMHRHEERAREVLEQLREGDDEADVDGELEEIEEANENERSTRVGQLFSGSLRPMLLVGLALAIAQQFVGVNTVIYYAPTILADTGLGNSAALAQTVAVGVTNLVFTIVAVLLLDRVGRRALLLTGTVGLLVALVVLGVYFSSSTLQTDYGWVALAGLLLFIAAFAIGLGPVFWLMISEIFPVGARSKAMAACTIVNWGANFLVARTLLSLSNAISLRACSSCTPCSRCCPWRSSHCGCPRPRADRWRRSRARPPDGRFRPRCGSRGPCRAGRSCCRATPAGRRTCRRCAPSSE